ncbi:MAG TPA: hypothetical protein VGI41_04595 [Candidatus Udaeobacter sp.]|jgi:hypothetical protein
MKTQFSLRIIFAGVLLLLVNGCTTSPQTGGGPLAGVWTNSLGTVWTIKADGTFHVVSTKPRREIWGTYTVAGDTVTIQETRRGQRRSRKSVEGPVFISLASRTKTL